MEGRVPNNESLNTDYANTEVLHDFESYVARWFRFAIAQKVTPLVKTINKTRYRRLKGRC